MKPFAKDGFLPNMDVSEDGEYIGIHWDIHYLWPYLKGLNMINGSQWINFPQKNQTNSYRYNCFKIAMNTLW